MLAPTMLAPLPWGRFGGGFGGASIAPLPWGRFGGALGALWGRPYETKPPAR